MKDTTMKFLLYAYFDITADEASSQILNHIIDRAYRDAASHVLSVPNEKSKIDRKRKSKESIAAALDRLGNNEKDEKEYFKWHTALCRELIMNYENCSFSSDQYGNVKSFTYGIAQKWVNMTMKYIDIVDDVLVYLKSEDHEFHKIYGEKIQCIKRHPPIDTYIMQAASDKNIKLPRKNGDERKYSSSSSLPWSK